MSGLVKVTVVAPAKIGATWYRAGEVAEVTSAERAELILAGVIAGETSGPQDASDASGVVTDSVIAAVIAERDAALAVARAAEAERDDLRARLRDLELRLPAAAQPVTLADPESGAGGKEETPVPDPAPKAAKARATKG